MPWRGNESWGKLQIMPRNPRLPRSLIYLAKSSMGVDSAEISRTTPRHLITKVMLFILLTADGASASRFGVVVFRSKGPGRQAGARVKSLPVTSLLL